MLGQLRIFRSGLAEIGERIDADAATRREIAHHFDVFGLHQTHQILHDDVDAIFVKIAVVAKAEEIEFEAFALHHLRSGNVADADFGKVGLSGDGTKRRELGTVELHPIIVAGMLVVKCLQHLGRIVGCIACGAPQSLQALIFSIHYFSD